MAGSSRSSPLLPLVDDFYLSAMFDNEEIFPISDEKYAEELTLQEALMSSAATTRRRKRTIGMLIPKEETSLTGKKVKIETGKTCHEAPTFCVVCMDTKPTEEMFRNDNCSYSFCAECIAATKIQENTSMVKFPKTECEGVLEPRLSGSIVPKEVFERWENASCECQWKCNG